MSTKAGSPAARAKLMGCKDCACFNLRKATRAVTQIYDEMLRPTGIRATQFSLLVAVSLTGPSTVTRLAELAVIDRTTLTRNLDVLEKQQLIDITPGTDRRTRLVGITQAGRNTLAQALPLWEQAQAQVLKTLGNAHWQSLKDNLATLIHAKETH